MHEQNIFHKFNLNMLCKHIREIMLHFDGIKCTERNNEKMRGECVCVWYDAHANDIVYKYIFHLMWYVVSILSYILDFI